MTRCALVALLTCVLLYSERFPVDDLAHVAIRVKLCTLMGEPHLFVEEQTYERLLTATGYAYRKIGTPEEFPAPLEEWWTTVKDARLYVTTTDPATGKPSP